MRERSSSGIVEKFLTNPRGATIIPSIVLQMLPCLYPRLCATVVVSSKVALEDFSLLPYFITRQYKASHSPDGDWLIRLMDLPNLD